MGNENGTEHKLFFRAFNAAKAKREAERQAREQEEQERAEAFALAVEEKENAEKALELALKGHNPNGAEIIKTNGYDIDTESKKLREFYINSTKS